MILAPLKPFIREAPLPDVVKTLVPPILFLLSVRSTATYNHTMFDTRRPPCEKGQSLVLAISMLALTLIAPWAFGQDLDPLTEILRQADQGNASAQSYLGFMYEIGEGVSKNEAEAMKWYRLAADQGEAVAQINLGRMYADGRGVPENDTEAVKWFRLAADQGVADAQFNLGVMYADGQGVPENDTEAVKWYRLAGRSGCRRCPIQPRCHVRRRTGRAGGLRARLRLVESCRRARERACQRVQRQPPDTHERRPNRAGTRNERDSFRWH